MEPPAPTVWPTLRSRDARALLRFLVDAFGFVETLVVDDGERVGHAELRWPLGGGVMVGSASPESDDRSPVRPGTTGCYVVCDDVDGLHRRAVDAGALTLDAPHDTEYGSREMSLADPDGNRWSFGTYRGAP
ncbi:MAG: VOC family protein [Acidobacteriota bacterium]|nr:VOC family protein [Acidobacteriota bacterium]